MPVPWCSGVSVYGGCPLAAGVADQCNLPRGVRPGTGGGPGPAAARHASEGTKALPSPRTGRLHTYPPTGPPVSAVLELYLFFIYLITYILKCTV